MKSNIETKANRDRRSFIGGSDARIVMGNDEAALLRLWREKRGEAAPQDLSGNLIVQLGLATEPLNRHWFERNTGRSLTDVQRRIRHPVIRWMGATLDGLVVETGSVFEANFMLPWSFSEDRAAEKYMAQLQHNMWVTNAPEGVLSILTGGGKWVEMLKELAPSVARVGVLMHPETAAHAAFWREAETAAARLGIEATAAGIHDAAETEQAQ